MRLARYGPDPLLKWPGGKRWLAPVLTSLLREELSGTYFEPMLGSGAVFLKLAPTSAHLADMNAELVSCLETIRDHPEAVIRRLWHLSNTADCFYRVRSMKPRTKVGLAARFVFLNRTCWGGLYRINRAGEFNVPFGNSKRVICRKASLMSVAKCLRGVRLRCADFEATIAIAGKGDVVYADPPYVSVGQNNGFVRYNEHLFAWRDQERLARASRSAARRGAFVTVSGLWHDSVLALYPGWWAIRVERDSLIAREVACRRPVSEVLIFSRRPRCWGSLPVAALGSLRRL